MKTLSVKAGDLQKKWLVIDAKGQTLGRLASEIARLLRGKHKPNFVPHMDCGDNVVVINAEQVHLTGNKWKQKHYYHHTGFVGGIKSTRADVMRDNHPERLLKIAVKGMLPHNKLGRKVLGNLKIYKGAEHPHTAQQPVAAAPRTKQA